MTEVVREETGAASVAEAMPVRPSYEQIIGSIKHAGAREILAHAKENEQRVARELAAIEEDQELTVEAKAHRADELIARYQDKISGAYASAREKVTASAETSYKFSIPMPGDGKTLATTRVADATELLAVQNETMQILTRAEQAKASATKGPKPAQDPRRRVLKEAYASAMATDGIEGKIAGLAAIKAAEALGIELEGIVADHRTQTHYNALEDHRRATRQAFALPSEKRIGNPFDTKRRGARSIGTHSSGNKVMTGGTKPLFPKKNRKPSWK
jgi:hypothetical protein